MADRPVEFRKQKCADSGSSNSCILCLAIIGFIIIVSACLACHANPEKSYKTCDTNCLTESCSYTICNGVCETFQTPCKCPSSMVGNFTNICKDEVNFEEKDKCQIQDFLIMIFGAVLMGAIGLNTCIRLLFKAIFHESLKNHMDISNAAPTQVNPAAQFTSYKQVVEQMEPEVELV